MMGDSTTTTMVMVVPRRWRGGQSNRWSGRLGISWFIDSMPMADGTGAMLGQSVFFCHCATHRPLGRRTSPRTRRLELAPPLEPLEPLERPSWLSWLTPCCT